MSLAKQWEKEPGPRLEGSRPLDSAKLQAPCIVHNPAGGFRLFYTAVGPEKPYPTCQGYLLSALSDDGLVFRSEPGIRLAPRADLAHMSLRILAPSLTRCGEDRWRMYFEARGRADRPVVICSAVSSDMLEWELEEGIRLQHPNGLGGPRYLPLPDGRGRLYCCGTDSSTEARLPKGVVSAITSDGLNFEFEPGYRMPAMQGAHDSGGISAAEVILPATAADQWSMVYSAWQDVPPGTTVPPHPSQDPNAVENGLSEDFAAASIASDLAGFRSRVYVAYSGDGLAWEKGVCALEGAGYEEEGLDAVHAEDMSLIEIGSGIYRMYYAACDRAGNWRIASAVSVGA